MRSVRWIVSFVILLFLGTIGTPAVQAQSVAGSTLRVNHAVLTTGTLQTVTVTARDRTGAPVIGAKGTLTVQFGATVAHYSLPATDRHGMTSVSFRPPADMGAGHVTLQARLVRGLVNISVSGQFQLTRPASAVKPAPSLQIVARALPSIVVAPRPEWIVIYARLKSGADEGNAPVDAAIMFKQGSAHVTAHTDSHGVATIRVNTGTVRTDQIVEVGVVVRAGNLVGTSATEFTAKSAAAAATPTPTPTPTRTPTPTPIVLAPPPTATPTPTAIPTDTPVPASTATPTATEIFPTDTPTSTPTFIPTATPTLTPTSTPTPTATPTSTPLPTSTSTPTPVCPDPSGQSQMGCMQYVLDLMNQSRADYAKQYGLSLQPLTLNLTQSFGKGNCVGSVGHSQAMQQSGYIWHQDSNYPEASFPNNICVGFTTAGENVGQWGGGDEPSGLQAIHNLMMNEQHDPNYCTQVINHACNIVSSHFYQVGIGIIGTDSPWLTEDFLG